MKRFGFGVVLAVGALTFAWFAYNSSGTQTLVDYDSGAIKQQHRFMFITLSESMPYSNVFGTWPLDDDRPGLTGVPDWRVVQSFRLGSTYSPSMEGGGVVRDIRTLGSQFLKMSNVEASRIKLVYLRTLQKRGPFSAHAVMNDALANPPP